MKNICLGAKWHVILFLSASVHQFSYSTVVFNHNWSSVGSHQLLMDGMAFVQKYRLKKEVVTKLLHKAKVKTWKGAVDLKTSRCTCWSSGLAGKRATAERLKHVSHIKCAVKKNTTTTETHWGHIYPETGLVADFTHDLYPREFPFNSLCKTSGLFAFLDKYRPTSCTCSPDNTLQRSIFLKRLIVFRKEIADG